jgi:hypothetical protein
MKTEISGTKRPAIRASIANMQICWFTIKAALGFASFAA